jgi:transcriptional regulator with XRE-family HTH domain
MTHQQLKAGRRKSGLTQVEAAQRLNVSQPYLSQLEKGERPITDELARAATDLYDLPATALPVKTTVAAEKVANSAKLARQLSNLGYPGFAHLRSRSKANPASVLLEALLQQDLEVRLSEALPWVLLRYPELDWPWLVRHLKVHDAQNRLGFLLTLAKDVAQSQPAFASAFGKLSVVEQELERARLVAENTLCRESMPEAERRWLREHRSPAARHWNLLTSLNAEQLSYAARY